MVVLGDATANHKTDPLILTTYLVLRHQFRFKRSLERLYDNEKLSAREIASKLGSSHSAVNEAVKKFKIKKPVKVRRPKFGRAAPSKSEYKLRTEEKTINFILKLKKSGLSFRKIAQILNKQKVSTPSGKGLWVQSTIKRIVFHKQSLSL